MAAGTALDMEGEAGTSRRIARAIAMHGTSRVREEGARLLAEVVRATGAEGAAYGWVDALAPHRMVPVHAVSRRPGVSWVGSEPGTSVVALDRIAGRSWVIMIRGAREVAIEEAAPLLERLSGWYADAGARDCPRLHPDARAGSYGRFVELLDGHRHVGFDPSIAGSPSILEEMRCSLAALPESARGAGGEVVAALGDLTLLSPALLRLGSALDAEGALAEAVSVHTIGYELALARCDGSAGIDAARMAGRAYRRLTDWSEAFRWYGLARRLAELERDMRGLVLSIDGAGHTHRARGAFPAARAHYREAWDLALDTQDPALVAAIGHSMMTGEREAGRLDEAARYGWAALQAQDDPRQRANLLLNIGTLLREAGATACAVDAYQIARRTAGDPETRMMAADALAYCAALRGDPGYTFWRRLARLESREAPSYLRAQVGYFRGAALQALGQHENAARVLRAVERYATGAGLHEWQMKAATLAEQPLSRPRPTRAPIEVERGLRELREAAV